MALAFIRIPGAQAASSSTLHAREHNQLASLYRHSGTVRFFHNHAWLARTRPGRVALRGARLWLPIIRRELAQTRAELRLRLHPLLPPHHALWMCIHGHEAGDWHNQDTGRNGHFGGLQMHPGWGYGTSYYASADSQSVQEWSAERGYRASGFSTTWLYGQWAHSDCLRFA